MEEERLFREQHKIAPPSIADTQKRNLKTAMKRSPQHPQVYVALFVLSLLIGLTGGCAKNAQTQWAQGREALTATEKKLSDAADAGKLDRKEILLADIGVKASRAALDDAQSRVDAGDVKAFKADMKMLNAILFRLAQTYLTTPTTQPVQP